MTIGEPDDKRSRSLRFQDLRDLFIANRDRRWTVRELAERFHVSPATIQRDIEELSRSGTVPLVHEGETNQSVWYLPKEFIPTLPPLHLNYEQGAALYIATRLLSQQHDEQIDGIQSAINALIHIMPKTLRPHLDMLTKDMQQRASGRTNLTKIFAILSQGWLRQQSVKILYDAPNKRSFTCTFSPYFVEPSGIGYTIYFIGWCKELNVLRTFKLERIRHAEFTKESFSLPSDFNGTTLLQSAWRVMFGEEGKTVHVKLRFTSNVSKRVRETRWHPSEQITETEHGLIWEADIGDTTEIKPWIRGWGSDCEVLEPDSLRTELLTEVRKLMRLYGLKGPEQTSDSPVQDIFNKLVN